MYVFAGLGNPGSKYAMNRHNIGFMAIDLIAQSYNFPPFKNKFRAEISEGKIGNHKIILCKPMTFMNLSGKAVQELMGFYKIPLDHLYVFHDDLDLLPFKVKLKLGGGSGGHNGLNSIDQHMGKEYWRLRLGIGHPGHKDAVSAYVLGNFRPDEEDDLCEILAAVTKEVPLLPESTPGAWLTRLHLHFPAK